MGEKKRILIADDEQYWRDKIVTAFLEEGHELVIASDVFETQELLWGGGAQPFDLVICDNNMHPHIPNCGLQIRDEMLITSHELANTPFILYTSDDSPLLLAKLPRLNLTYHRKNHASQADLVGLARGIFLQ